MGEHEEGARLQVGRDVRLEDRLLGRVGDEDHDDVGAAHGVGDIGHPQARVLGDAPALRGGREPHHDVHARFPQVERVRVALASEPDDRDRLAGERRGVGIRVVVHPRCHRFVASSMDCEPRDITTVPVRTSSLIP